MTIYATQFNYTTKRAATASVDSGFTSLSQVVDTFGAENCDTSHARIVVHGNGVDRVAFSDFVFSVDGDVTTG